MKNFFKTIFALIPAVIIIYIIVVTPATTVGSALENLFVTEKQPSISETLDLAVTPNDFDSDEKETKYIDTIANQHLRIPWYRDHLTATEQATYDELLEAIFGYSEQTTLNTQPDKDTLNKCLQYIMNDRPEIFWLSSTLSYVMTGDAITSVEFQYKMNKEEIDAIQYSIDKKIQPVIDKVTNSEMSEYEKVKYIYTWVCDNIDYQRNTTNSQDIQGALYDGVTACAGYAHTMQLLCNKSGIKCIYLTGPSGDIDEEQVPHAWNAVEIDGRICYVDATWGDKGEDNLSCDYAWLGLSYKSIDISHDFDNEELVPTETTERYEIWNINDTRIDDIKSDEAYERIAKSIREGDKNLTLRFSSLEKMRAAFDWVLNDPTLVQKIADEFSETEFKDAYEKGVYLLYEEPGLNSFTIEWLR